MNFRIHLKMKTQSKPRRWLFSEHISETSFSSHYCRESEERYHVLTPEEHIPQYLKMRNNTALPLGLFVFHHFLSFQAFEELSVSVSGLLSLSYTIPDQTLPIYNITVSVTHQTVLVTSVTLQHRGQMMEIGRVWFVVLLVCFFPGKEQWILLNYIPAHVNSGFFLRRA